MSACLVQLPTFAVLLHGGGGDDEFDDECQEDLQKCFDMGAGGLKT